MGKSNNKIKFSRETWATFSPQNHSPGWEAAKDTYLLLCRYKWDLKHGWSLDSNTNNSCDFVNFPRNAYTFILQCFVISAQLKKHP